MQRFLFPLIALGLVTGTPAHAQDSALRAALKSHLPKKGAAPDIDKPIMADLDGDGRAEGIVRYCIDENSRGGKNEGANNPANVHCHLAVFENAKGGWHVLGQIGLGQGEVRDVKNGVIYVETLTFGPKDPLCCPSQKRVARLALKNKRLVQVR